MEWQFNDEERAVSHPDERVDLRGSQETSGETYRYDKRYNRDQSRRSVAP
jgi:hypothetical protein